MAKRLHMTEADYLAIAVSPALIMLLVGSLVFFLIEVLYVGEYQARLNYVFALFVFATVLIGRISIEMGSERAALYSVPLALAVFVVLQRFVEHPSPLSPLINLLLIAIVWWCAHKLTWDCTLIDDDEDASGEGLLQRMGIDEGDGTDETPPLQRNEPLGDEADRPPWWKRPFIAEAGPHTPGLWVLYFSLAALPLFGVGQRFIDATDSASRRYVFVLLFVYVAAGLSLLVTTSFLGFRRYLRQRQVEMPAPMAATWVTVGGLLTAVVLLLALLLPRPRAEYAIAQPPWQIQSPTGQQASRYGRGSDGVQGEQSAQSVVSDQANTTGDAISNEKQQQTAAAENAEGDRTAESGSQRSDSQGESSVSTEGQQDGPSSESSSGGSGENEENADSSNRDGESTESGESEQAGESTQPSEENASSRSDTEQSSNDTEGANATPDQTSPPNPQQVVQQITNSIGGLSGLLKLLFYVALALLALYLGWKYRDELLAAVRDIIRDIRAWFARAFGRSSSPTVSTEADESARRPPRRQFRDFRNPFGDETYRKTLPGELVRYTFEAFEAWCAERGAPRSTDQTPQEFVRSTIASEDPIYKVSRRLARLYSQSAYGERDVAMQEVIELQILWRHMDQAPSLR